MQPAPGADPPPGEVEIVRSPSARLVGELSLVLHAIGVAHGRVQGPGYQSLVVRAEDAGRAAEELARYQRENRAWPPPRPATPTLRAGAASGWVYALVLLAFDQLARLGAFGLDWDAAGRVDGARIQAGEVWRGTTGLFLHSDIVHLASNVVFGALFGVLVSQVHGVAIGWLAVLVAGSVGNLLNSWAQGFENLSIGASTAVFGALGVLAATQWAEKLRLGHGTLARWAPLLAAGMLLGWQGMGSARIELGRGVVRDPDDRTDVGAHIFGFGAGLALGAALAWLRLHRPPGARAERAAAVALALVPSLAWALALWRAG